jgi:hypothetical protein
MPDQPHDPLHYEMKLPPEPRPEKKSGQPEPQRDDTAQRSENSQDSGSDGDDDRPYTDRRPS